MDEMTDLTPETVGEMLAQAFHRGFEAGKKVGAEVMQKAAVEHCVNRGKSKALFGNMVVVADEIQALTVLQDNVKL